MSGNQNDTIEDPLNLTQHLTQQQLETTNTADGCVCVCAFHQICHGLWQNHFKCKQITGPRKRNVMVNINVMVKQESIKTSAYNTLLRSRRMHPASVTTIQTETSNV